MEFPDYFVLGAVMKPHGIKGELKVFLDVDDPHYYNDLKRIFLIVKNELCEFPVESIQVLREQEAILKLKNINSRTDAEHWSGKDLYLPVSELPPLEEEDDFYYHDIIGFLVNDHILGEMGRITNFMEMPAQDLLVIAPLNGKEILIPAVDEFIYEVDFDAETVFTTLPEGFMELFD